MKTYSILILLSLFICGGSAKFATTSRSLSAFNPKRALKETSVSQQQQTPVADSEEEKDYPYIRVDFEYRRTGTFFLVYHGVTIQQCLQYCRSKSDSCLGINYQIHLWECSLLSTLGSVVVDSAYSTCLVNYAENDDPCNATYSIKTLLRAGFYYKVFYGDEAQSATDCCQKCQAESKAGCVVWEYDSSTKRCFLQNTASILRPGNPANAWSSGFGVVTSSTRSQTQTVQRTQQGFAA